MSDRGKGEREREIKGEKVEVANLVPCCISPSQPCRKRRGGEKKNHCVCSSDRFIGRRAMSCCGSSYLTLNELSECLPQQVNKSAIPRCGHGGRVNVESIRCRAEGDRDSGKTGEQKSSS